MTVVPEQIQFPSMTADWEEKLLEIKHDSYDGDDFMSEITDMIVSLVKNYEAIKGADILLNPKGKVIGNCAACGNEVTESEKGWFCTGKDCNFALWKDNNYFKKIGKQMTVTIAEQLVKHGKAHLKGCVSVKTRKKYDATIVVTPGE